MPSCEATAPTAFGLTLWIICTACAGETPVPFNNELKPLGEPPLAETAPDGVVNCVLGELGGTVQPGGTVAEAGTPAIGAGGGALGYGAGAPATGGCALAEG